MSSRDANAAISSFFFGFFFFNAPATTEIYTLSLHDALPISLKPLEEPSCANGHAATNGFVSSANRSEEHTSELQSRRDLVCRLLLEKKNSVIETDPLPFQQLPFAHHVAPSGKQRGYAAQPCR